MQAGYTILARLFVIILACLAGYGVSVALGPKTLIQLLFLFGSVISVTFFSINEKKYLAIGVIFPILILGLLEYSNYEPLFGIKRYQLTTAESDFLRITTFAVIWMMMLGHFTFFIIDRRKAQAQLISSEKMVALGRMATEIAHEVNNPLQTIVGHAERLKSLSARGTINPAEAVLIADKIQTVAMRIASIIRGLKALARDASGDPFSELRLSSIIAMTLDQCLSQLDSNGIKVSVKKVPETWTVVGREAQLSQVILNVITNAQDAISGLKEKWINIEARQTNLYIDVVITDSGSGISSEVQKKIFEPFFTTKPAGKGIGLGLSVSREIMAAHNGLIYYDEASLNTRFIIRIPKGSGVLNHKEQTSSNRPSSSPPRRNYSSPQT